MLDALLADILTRQLNQTGIDLEAHCLDGEFLGRGDHHAPVAGAKIVEQISRFQRCESQHAIDNFLRRRIEGSQLPAASGTRFGSRCVGVTALFPDHSGCHFGNHRVRRIVRCVDNHDAWMVIDDRPMRTMWMAWWPSGLDDHPRRMAQRIGLDHRNSAAVKDRRHKPLRHRGRTTVNLYVGCRHDGRWRHGCNRHGSRLAVPCLTRDRAGLRRARRVSSAGCRTTKALGHGTRR